MNRKKWKMLLRGKNIEDRSESHTVKTKLMAVIPKPKPEKASKIKPAAKAMPATSLNLPPRKIFKIKTASAGLKCAPEIFQRPRNET